MDMGYHIIFFSDIAKMLWQPTPCHNGAGCLKNITCFNGQTSAILIDLGQL